MNKPWTETILGEMIELKRGYDLPQQDRRPGSVPVVSSSGTTDYHAEAKVEGPGVVTGRYGTIGQVFYVPQDFWPLNTTLYVCDFKGNDRRFISYFLRSIDFLAYSDKAAVPGVNRNHLHQAKVKCPPLKEQQAIATLLASLDDKIQANQSMNETLQATAEALFHAWFVNSAAEELPTGWQRATVDQEFRLTMGQSPPGDTYNETGTGTPLYQGSADFGFRYPTPRVFCTAPTRFAEPGDTLVSVRAPVGSVNMTQSKCCVGRGVAAVRHKTGSRSYTYYFMRSLKKDFARFEAEGTVFGSINKADFHRIECVAPPKHLIQEFEATAYPLDQLIESNEAQSNALGSLRDVLLPKLLSGDVRLPTE